MSTMPHEVESTAGRRRLLATARDLFTSRGASNVGINEVTAAAGVARMTLYNNFPSKDALIAAVYQQMVETELEALDAIDRGEVCEEQAVLSVFDHFEERVRNGHHRGCPFIHASLQTIEPEGEVHSIVKRYKLALKSHILSLLDPSRLDRAELADALLILMDGAMAEAYLGAVQEPVTVAKRVASVLLKAGRKASATTRPRRAAR